MKALKISSHRFAWADITRVIAIYLVIVIHSSTLPRSIGDLTTTWPFALSLLVAKVSVPLFVMLSGALLLEKKETYKVFFKKRIVKVLLPWIVWTFIYMWWNYTTGSKPTTISEWKYFFESTFLTQLWFLPMIFSLYIITPILRLIIPSLKEADKIYIFIVWFLWVGILPFFHTSPAFPQPSQAGLLALALYYSGYFFTGYFITKLKLPDKTVLFSFVAILVGVILSFIELLFVKNISISQAVDYFAPGVIIMSLGTFTLIYYVFTKKIKNFDNGFIASLSRASLGIYIVHFFVKIFLDGYIYKYLLGTIIATPFSSYIDALIIFLVSFLVVFLLQRVPLVRQIVP